MNILLTGTYNSRNKADAAMELSAIEAFKSREPANDVAVVSPFPGLDVQFYSPTKVVPSL